ncbi:MAG: hypothetical protein MR971_01800 [Bacteroidales bacterium]|nr:hypothetical protein [Bacteroidales bacterium]
MPSRSLSYAKIVQGESKEKEKPQDFLFFAEPPPIFAQQSSARREQRKRKAEGCPFFFAEPQPVLCKDSARREQRKEKQKNFFNKQKFQVLNNPYEKYLVQLGIFTRYFTLLYTHFYSRKKHSLLHTKAFSL